LILALSVVLALGGSTLAEAAEWQADTTHSVLTFKIRHLFSKVQGGFDEWSANLFFDPEAMEQASVEVTIQAASIDTGNEKRDGHLRSADFFDVEQYPTITFVSSMVEQTDEGYLVHGTLTMHGVSKEIAIPVEFLGAGPDPWGRVRAGFSGSVTIDRKDYGMEWNKALDKGGVMLGDEVEIDIEIEAVEADA
jgi:polyisoprenoid-binding protein YceI